MAQLSAGQAAARIVTLRLENQSPGERPTVWPSAAFQRKWGKEDELKPDSAPTTGIADTGHCGDPKQKHQMEPMSCEGSKDGVRVGPRDAGRHRTGKGQEEKEKQERRARGQLVILSLHVFCIILYLIEFLYNNSHFEFFSGNSSFSSTRRVAIFPEQHQSFSCLLCLFILCPHIAICTSGRSVLPVVVKDSSNNVWGTAWVGYVGLVLKLAQ